jgi:hypothetical protein
MGTGEDGRTAYLLVHLESNLYERGAVPFAIVGTYPPNQRVEREQA